MMEMTEETTEDLEKTVLVALGKEAGDERVLRKQTPTFKFRNK